MNRLKQRQKKNAKCKKLPTIAKVVIGLFVIGLASGALTGYLFEGRLYAPLLNTYSELSGSIQDYHIDREAIFLITVKRSLKLFFLLLLFCITNLWCYYLSAFVFYTGFTNGLLLAFCILLHHANGVVRYLIYQLPQALLFVPLYLVIICHCHGLHREFIKPPNLEFGSLPERSAISTTSKKGKLLFFQFPFVLASLLFLLLGCLLEAYANVPLLTWYSSHV